MTQALKGRKLVLVGFTLFSMFFGAGNLIFPPDLGAKAGANLWPAFLGLAISAVGLPVAGVIAVARADGLDKLAAQCEHLVVVSNEVFSGGANYAGDTDRYLKALAQVNNALAARADAVVRVVCGIPVYHKGGPS